MADMKLEEIIGKIHNDLSPDKERQNTGTGFFSLVTQDNNTQAKSDYDLPSIIKKASSGSFLDREYVIEEIYKLLLSKFRSTVTNSTIDDIIRQYHVNYYKPLYTGSLSGLQEALSIFLIEPSMQFQYKLRRLSQIIYQELYGLSVIDGFEFIADMNEVGCNGKDYIWVQFNGVKRQIKSLRFKSDERLAEVAKKAISHDAKSDLNPTNPEILCQRYNGSRVTALCFPYTEGIQLNIRNFDVKLKSPKEFIDSGVSTKEAETFIDDILEGRPNIVVIGDQSVGKTTYVLRIMSSLPDYLAIGTLEPMFELNARRLFKNKNIIPLQILPELKDSEQSFETFLRLGRDLIINGEIRSPDDALVTVKAMLRQGRGSISTFHSTTILDFIYDYRNLLMQTRNYSSEHTAELDIARAIDIVILIKIDRKTGRRYIAEIAEIKCDYDNKNKPFKINSLFMFDKQKDKLIATHRMSEQLVEHLKVFDIPDENLNRIDDLFKDVIESD